MNKKPKKTIFETKNISEEDFISAVNKVAKKLIYKFKFGYHSSEDMKQQAMIFAIEGLEKYDPSKPLENFLWTHIRNRLFNYKRDNYHRPNNVCLTCPFYDRKFEFSDNQCKKFKNKKDCELYTAAEKQNETKKSIKNASGSENQNIKNTHNLLDDIINKEILLIIEDRISLKYREDYLKLKGGIKISKKNREKLKEHLLKIIKNYNDE